MAARSVSPKPIEPDGADEGAVGPVLDGEQAVAEALQLDDRRVHSCVGGGAIHHAERKTADDWIGKDFGVGRAIRVPERPEDQAFRFEDHRTNSSSEYPCR
jgi:hypothetical protein